MDKSIKNTFNLKSLFSFHTVMWVGMAGMALMMMGSYPSATVLDWVISVPLHIVQGTVHMFTGGGLETMSALWNNAMAGNILPNHMGDMLASAVTGTSPHTAAAVTAGHVHGAAAITNQWQWFGSLMPFEQSKMIADATFYGVPLDQYVSNWCAENGLTFAP